MRVIDLGCGTGELTVTLHERLEADATLGIDSSVPMLERALDLHTDGVNFQLSDMETFQPQGTFDLGVYKRRTALGSGA